tara:strand:+ start:281 stop:667 length:387 start_codon:yes stop_codon:yes gene_type:complete
VAWQGAKALCALAISPYGETACRLWAALASIRAFVRGANYLLLHQPTSKEPNMAQGQNDFDFNNFNAMTERKPAGLQIFLAQQLLSNALWSMEKYDNPRSFEVRDALNSIKALRQLMKDDAAARAKQD